MYGGAVFTCSMVAQIELIDFCLSFGHISPFFPAPDEGPVVAAERDGQGRTRVGLHATLFWGREGRLPPRPQQHAPIG